MSEHVIRRVVASFEILLDANDFPEAVLHYETFEDILLEHADERARELQIAPPGLDARRIIEWRIAGCDTETQTVTFGLDVDFE